MSETVFTGIIRGKTIELDAKPELPDGQQVTVTVQPLACPCSPEAWEVSLEDALQLRLAAVPETATALKLVNAPLTDAGIAQLLRLENLERLDLTGTHITDEGLLALGALPRLEWVCVSDTKVTADGLNLLQAAHPALTIVIGSGPGQSTSRQLLSERIAFQRELPRLLATGQEGRWALIQGDKLDSVWDTHLEASDAGHLRFGGAQFLVQEVLTKPRSIRINWPVR